MSVDRGTEALFAFRRRFFRRAFERTGGVGFPASLRGPVTEPDLSATALVLPQAAYCLNSAERKAVVGWMLTHQGPGGGFASRTPTTLTPAAITAFVHNALVAMQLRGIAGDRWAQARRQASGWLAALCGGHTPSSAVSPAELGSIATALAVTVGLQHAPLLYRTLDAIVGTLSHRLGRESGAAQLWLARGVLGVFHELGSRGHLEQVAATVDVLTPRHGAEDDLPGSSTPDLGPAHEALLVLLACEVDRANRVQSFAERLSRALDRDGVLTVGPREAFPGDPLALDMYASSLAHEALCRYAEQAEGRTQIPIWIRIGDGELESSPFRKQLPGRATDAPGLSNPRRSGHVRTVFLPHEPVGQACPYLRVHAPLSSLNGRSHIGYELGTDPTLRYVLLSTSAFDRADVLIYQRLFPAWLLGAMTLPRIERSGAAVIYDIDDLLFDMPHDHPKVGAIMPALPELRRALVTADLVTTSTSALARRLDALGARRTIVIPNAIDPLDWPAKLPEAHAPGAGRPVVIGCVGTSTHRADYERISGVLLEILARHRGRVELVIWGDAPASLAEHPAVTVDPTYVSSYREYAEKLSRTSIDIGLAPLAPNAFNESKSAIKWLEFSAAGIPGVYPDIGQYTEWVRNGEDGVLVEDDPDAWLRAIDGLIRNPTLRLEMARRAYASVRREHTMEASAAVWLHAIEEARRLRRERRLKEMGKSENPRKVRNPIRIPLAELLVS